MDHKDLDTAIFGLEKNLENYGRRAQDKEEIAAIAKEIQELAEQRGIVETSLYVARYLHALQHRGTTAEIAHSEADMKSKHDTLTGLYNRGAFLEKMEGKIAKGKTGTLIFLDLDHLKEFNDGYGHQAGDEALKLVAAALNVKRKEDMVGRLGGDEFVAWVEGDVLEAFQFAVKVSKTLADISQGSDLTPTLSIGIAQRNPEQSTSEWLHDADSAAYAVKSGGRNGIAIWGPRRPEFEIISPNTRLTFTTTPKPTQTKR